MTQRNPMNPRSQAKAKGESVGNSSRKSAARAKPKSAAGASVYVASKDAKTKASKTKTAEADDKATQEADRARKRERAMGAQVLDTEEYRKWRRIWWIAIVAAVAGVLLSWLCTYVGNNGIVDEATAEMLSPVGIVLLVIGYAGIIFALWIDLGKIRKMRRAQEESVYSMSKSELRQLDAQIDANEQAAAASKAARRARRPWNRKKSA